MSIKWSFAADRCFRRCQRQFFFSEIADWNNARDPMRRESVVLKQLKPLELWRGLLIHRGIELFVVPRIAAGTAVDWESVRRETLAMADMQLAFSARQEYWASGVTKTASGDEYCALLPHELGHPPSAEEADKVYTSVEKAFLNLSAMAELWEQLRGRGPYKSEIAIRLQYDEANIEVQLDLLYFRAQGKPTIVEWKAYESIGGSDGQLQTALYAWALSRSGRWRGRPEDIEIPEGQLLTPALIRPTSTEQSSPQPQTPSLPSP